MIMMMMMMKMMMVIAEWEMYFFLTNKIHELMAYSSSLFMIVSQRPGVLEEKEFTKPILKSNVILKGDISKIW